MLGVWALVFCFNGCDKIGNGDENSLCDGIFKYEYTTDSKGYAVVGFAEKKAVANLEIPAKYKDKPVLEISDYAFDSCKIGQVTISDSVLKIGKGAFRNCAVLELVKFGKNVTLVDEKAFEQCIKLRQIDMNEGLETIASRAFYDCKRLETIEHPNSLKVIGNNAYEKCEILSSVTFGNSLEEIGEYAFAGLNELKTIVFSDFSPTVIKNYAFSNCNGLMKLNIGNGVKAIGDYAFYYCGRLNWLVVGDSVTSIGERAFVCNELVYVQLGKNVQTIGYAAFYCYKLVEIYNRSNLPLSPKQTDYAEYGYITSRAYHVYVEGESSYLSVVGDGLVIYTEANEKILITQDGTDVLYDLKIPNGVTKIWQRAFYDNQRIVKVTIPDSVTEVGDMAFTFCNKLETVIFGDGVESLGSTVLGHTYYLKEVVIGEKIKTIPDSTFYNAGKYTGILKVYYKGGNTQHLLMEIGENNTKLLEGSWYYYSKIEPTSDGAYWYYDQYGKIKLWETT